jgi:5-methylthioadenosine/S-adenosylhomocysteine deaminase
MQDCELIVTAGTILTDALDPVIEDCAIAIAGQRIAAVGPRARIDREWRAAARLDCGGGIALPGLVNIHNHTPLTIVRGIVEDMGWAPAYTPSIPQGYRLSEADVEALSCLGAWELLRHGSTTAVDHYVHADALARSLERVGLRAFVGGWIVDVDMPKVAEGRWVHDPGIARETVDRARAFNAAWTGRTPRIAPVLVPHAPDTCSRALLEQVAEEAERSGLPVHIHLSQSPVEVARIKEREGMTPPALLAETGLLDRHLVAAHCIHIDDADIARLGRARVRVAHSPLGNASAGWIAPVQRLERAGARISLCTDAKSSDMFEAMRMAIAGGRLRAAGAFQRPARVDTRAGGRMLGGGGGGLELSAARALAWATTGGAEAVGLAGKTGALRPGMLADIIVLDGAAPNLRPLIRPLGAVVHNGSGVNVRHAVIDGEVVMRDGRPTRFDAEEVIIAAEEAARRLWRDCGFAVPM